MTKDQIDTWRAILFNTHPGNEWRELCDLAERGLVHEKVLAHLRRGGCDPGMRILCKMCRGDYERAAIDRAEADS